MLAAGCTSTPTDATCPTTDAPTYQTFAQPFFAQYCASCHSRSSTNRHGAPSDHNYDTEDDLRAHAGAIDEVAAKGPAANNTVMPELGGTVNARPSDADREKLGQYLACLQAQ